MRRAWDLARVVTPERAPYLGRVLVDLLELSRNTTDDDAFRTAIMYWAQRVDEIVEPRRAPRHALMLHPRSVEGSSAIRIASIDSTNEA